MIAEFGHHVQNLLGIMDQVAAAQRDDPENANELSVRLELQADCLAGVWAHSAYEDNLLEEGDLEEGLTAAAAAGDDRIQQDATGRIDRRASPTAPPRSGRSGSSAASTRARSRPATPSPEVARLVVLLRGINLGRRTGSRWPTCGRCSRTWATRTSAPTSRAATRW